MSWDGHAEVNFGLRSLRADPWGEGGHRTAVPGGTVIILPEHGLDIDDGFGVGHVVFLRTHGALLVHHDQVVSVDDPTLEQVVQAVPFRKQQEC